MTYEIRNVTLKPAYVFDCPDCGGMVTVLPIPAELDDEAREQAAEFPEVPLDGWVTAPEHVRCPHCKQDFYARNDDGDKSEFQEPD